MKDQEVKIIDAFIFYNEINQLQIRLNELYEVVDFFVIVEASVSFSGRDKEYVFLENIDLFKKYLNKIIHIAVDDMPEILQGDRWQLESHQRNAILRGLNCFNDNDIVLISDVDEIPNPKDIPKLKRSLSKKPNALIVSAFRHLMKIRGGKFLYSNYIERFLRVDIIRFKQKHFEYFLNGFVNSSWKGTVVIRKWFLSFFFSNDIHYLRFSHFRMRQKIISSGWHFSYLGGLQAIQDKIKNFAHSEFDREEYTSDENILDAIERGRNLFGKAGETNIEYIEIDNTFPKTITDNVKKYKHLIK